MRIKFACAVSIAAAVALATACGKKSDGEAESHGSEIRENRERNSGDREVTRKKTKKQTLDEEDKPR